MHKFGIYTIISPTKKGGVGRILEGYLPALQSIDSVNRYVLYIEQSNTSDFQNIESNFEVIRCNVTAKSRFKNHLFQSIMMPLMSVRNDLDVIHFPNTALLPYHFRPTIVTIHDLTEFVVSEKVYSSTRTTFRKLANRISAKSANILITDSVNSKNDIIHYLNVEQTKVKVVYPGINPRFRPIDLFSPDQKSLKEKYGLPDHFILFVGQVQPRKNLTRLIKAFHSLNGKYKDLYLVLAGKLGWMYSEINATIENLGLQKSVIFLGYIDDDDLPGLYCLSKIFAFPSLYEGFGFPVLEAMSCGVPVITSNSSSLAEIADGAAILVDPQNIDNIAWALDTCLGSSEVRENLRLKGLERASQFSWTNYAKQIVDIYATAAEL